MSRRLIVRPEAEAEMNDAFDWYEARVPGLGSEFLLCVDAVFNSILRNRVVVLSVFHARRNPSRWQERI